MDLRLRVLLVAAALAGASLTAPAQAQNVDRQLRRPDAHSFLGAHGSATTSFVERTISLTGSGGSLDFDYFVDSEADHDFLRVFLDSAQAFEASGRNRAGHVRLPLSSGNHVVRFAYHKDAAGDVGRDVAWVDRLKVSGGGSLSETEVFDLPRLEAPAGYTAGGFGGGWAVAEGAQRRGIRRSFSGAFKGYSPGGTRSASERIFTWPAGSARNQLVLQYFVDSEQDRDFFKVFVDGTEKLVESGPERSKRAVIDVGGPGAHTIRLEYVKDESIDEGMDDAVVLHLEARADGKAFEIGGFDGQDTGALPDGWQMTPGAQAEWVVGPGPSPRMYVRPLDLDAPPQVDGELGSDYKQATRLSLRDSHNVTGALGEGELLFNVDPPSLSLILRAEGRTTSVGSEQGELTAYIDAKRVDTLSGGGCAPDVLLPSTEDRRFRISYDSAVAEDEAGVTIVQEAGTCAATTPWQAVSGSEAWPVTAAVVEYHLDPGFVFLELRIGLEAASDVMESGRVGFGFSMDSAPTLSYRVPSHDSLPLLEQDVSSWETLLLEEFPRGTRALAHTIVDGFPRP